MDKKTKTPLNQPGQPFFRSCCSRIHFQSVGIPPPRAFGNFASTNPSPCRIGSWSTASFDSQRFQLIQNTAFWLTFLRVIRCITFDICDSSGKWCCFISPSWPPMLTWVGWLISYTVHVACCVICWQQTSSHHQMQQWSLHVFHNLNNHCFINYGCCCTERLMSLLLSTHVQDPVHPIAVNCFMTFFRDYKLGIDAAFRSCFVTFRVVYLLILANSPILGPRLTCHPVISYMDNFNITT